MTILHVSDTRSEWWAENGGFFGRRYVEGDDSREGHLSTPHTLQERTQREAAGVVGLLGLRPGQSVLDCPCGYGRHSIALAERGQRVVGVDINGEELNIARQRAALAGDARFVKRDMRNLDFSDQFDAVINMFYSFGFFNSDAENRAVLGNFYTALKSGGKFLMHTDVNIPRVLHGRYKSVEQRTLRNGKALKIVDTYDPVRKRINGCWTLIHADGREERMTPYSVRVHTFEEFATWCRSVGFTKVTGYGDWNGSPLTDDSEEMVVVAEKGAA